MWRSTTAASSFNESGITALKIERPPPQPRSRHPFLNCTFDEYCLRHGELSNGRVLLVDFNNFSRYPTIAIGFLAAVLRQSEYEVDVFSPFAKGIDGVVREPSEGYWSLWGQKARYWSSTLESPTLRKTRSSMAFLASSQLARSRRKVAEGLRIELEIGPLISTNHEGGSIQG